jgi:hypothetical protein
MVRAPRKGSGFRVQDEVRAALQAQTAAGHQLALGKTTADGDAYPTYPSADCTLVFPMVLVEGTFDEAAGNQLLTTADRSSQIKFVYNLAEVFLPQNTVIWVFRYTNRWWTDWPG